MDTAVTNSCTRQHTDEISNMYHYTINEWTHQTNPGCIEYRKVDSVLRSVEEERDEFTGGQFLKKLIRFKACVTITQTI